MPLDSQPKEPPLVNPQEWLETVQSPTAVESAPPSFEELETSSKDSSVKAMAVNEDNMKFPQSMKDERAKSGATPDDLKINTQL
jgi:hypothetical protein